jgi:hypothetical protein
MFDKGFGACVMRSCILWVVALATMALTACTGARVDEALSDPNALKQHNQAVTFFRVVPPDPSCTSVGVQIAQKDGEFFKPVRVVKLERLSVTWVAEVLLSPGTYHVVGVACYRPREPFAFQEPQGNGLMRRSFATFTVAAGEVLNLGQLAVSSHSRTAGVYRSFHAVSFDVTDWPLAELERFKSQRPKHYAEMKVRLMTLPAQTVAGVNSPVNCGELTRLQAEGKVQNLPAACAASAGAKK